MPANRSETTAEARDLTSEIRAWLLAYSGMSVSRHDAEALRDFLVKSGWVPPHAK